jgi:hypothetical protein
MKALKGLAISLSLAATFGFGLANADEVRVPISEQGAKSGIEIPKSGITQASVEQKYGSPQSVHGPVGDPPITKWVYQGFTVYFEYDRVIHTVIHHQ